MRHGKWICYIIVGFPWISHCHVGLPKGEICPTASSLSRHQLQGHRSPSLVQLVPCFPKWWRFSKKTEVEKLKRQDWNGGKEGQWLQQRGSLSSNVNIVATTRHLQIPSKSSKKAVIPNYGPSSQRWKSIQNNHSSNQQPDHVGLSLKTTLGDTGIPGIRTPLAALRQWWDSISMSFYDRVWFLKRFISQIFPVPNWSK